MDDRRVIVLILQQCNVCGPLVNALLTPVRDGSNNQKSTTRVQRFRQKQQLVNELAEHCRRCGPLVKRITG